LLDGRSHLANVRAGINEAAKLRTLLLQEQLEVGAVLRGEERD
jgi:hypothetical protein